MPGFPRDASHWLDFPEEVTGLAAYATDLVVFSRTGIWLVTGEGPSTTGVGQFLAPRRVPTDLGCVDWRSVLSTSIGVFYQSRSGIMLLTGQGPAYIGHAIADELEARPYVVRAALHGEGDSAVARFVLADDPEAPTSTRVVSYSLRARAWSVDTYALDQVEHLGEWRDASGGMAGVLAGADLDDGVLVETPGAAEYAVSRLETGEIAPYGFGTEFRLSRVWFRFTERGPCTVTVTALFDDQQPGDTGVETFTIGVATGSGTVRREWRPRTQNCKSVRFVMQDEADGDATSRGVDYLGLVLEVTADGPHKLPTAGRR